MSDDIHFIKNEPKHNAEQTINHINRLHGGLRDMFIGAPKETEFSFPQKELEAQNFVGIYEHGSCTCVDCKLDRALDTVELTC